MAIEKICVPDIGDFSDVEIIEVLVAKGDTVQVEDSLITLESDKASMEIPSPAAGVVVNLSVALGDKVSEGSTILELEVSEAASEATTEPDQPEEKPAETPEAESESKKTAAESVPSLPTAAPAVPAQTANTDVIENKQAYGSLIHASPKVRRLATMLGVDLSQVKGSAPKGRVNESDVRNFVKSVMQGQTSVAAGSGIPPVPTVDFSTFGTVEHEPLSRIKKISGKHLAACWLNVPHVTQFNDADVTELEAYRKSLAKQAEGRGVKVTPLAFVIKAVCAALHDHPNFNASLSGEELVKKQYYNIGVAVDTPNGLVVPVIRDVNQKGIWDIVDDLAELSEKARMSKLTPTNLSGACFSISSLGGIGGTYFTPIVNAPEVAILGVGRSSVQPVWDGNAFQPRLMLPLALSYDHRVIDGAQGARFIVSLTRYLSDIRHLVL